MGVVLRLLNFLLLSSVMCLPLVLPDAPFPVRFAVTAAGVFYFAVYNIIPTFRKYPSVRLKIMGDGAELLLMFFMTGCVSLAVASGGLFLAVTSAITMVRYIVYLVIMVIMEAVLFFNGIIRVYFTSVQLGFKLRVLAVLLAWVPVVNLVILFCIYRKVRRECDTETALAKKDEQRAAQQVCRTKYPILLVHGVFFRDSKYLNYWGRVPAELKKNGAVIYYGEQQSALAVADSAEELAARIKEICESTGCEKLNIIAHSKGGLDSRYAISKLGCDRYVASLTTINTPHRGCIFAEYLLGKAPEKLVSSIENTYNAAFRKLGDPNPDFMAAVKNLTNSFCADFNRDVPDAEGVMYQSFGSVAKNFKSGRFPLNVSYPLVKHFDGDNDGLVALSASEWGEKFTPVYPQGKRGITHADVIDLNREDFKGFDVREFYVGIVSELKVRGF